MFYLLHGDDEFTSREQLKKLRQQGNFDYNQDSYSGGEVTLATITATCDTLPFLTDSRLVVVEGLPKKRRNETASSQSETSSANTDETTAPATAGKGSKAKKGKKSSKANTGTRAGFEKGWPTTFLPCLIPLSSSCWSMKSL